MAGHQHSASCYKWQRACGLEVHVHNARCHQYGCPETAHTHSRNCDDSVQVCGTPEGYEET